MLDAGFPKYKSLLLSAVLTVAMPLNGNSATGLTDSVISYPSPTKSSTTAIEMSLSECIMYALRNNRDLESSYLDRIVQKFSLLVAEDEFGTDVTVDLSGNYTIARDQNVRDDGRTGSAQATVSRRLETGGQFSFVWNNAGSEQPSNFSNSATVSYSQPLLKGAGFEVATASQRISRINEDSNILSLKSTVMGKVFEVIQSYRSFMQAKRQLEINERSLDRAREQLQINRALVDAGRMAEVELVQTNSDIANKEVSLLTSQNSFDSARLALLRILDIDKRTSILATEEIEAEPVRLEYTNCLRLAFDQRPDYLQALLNHRTSEISLMLAENNRLWNLSLNANYTVNGVDRSYLRSASNAADFNNTNWFAGLTLSIPWYGDLSREQGVISAEIALEKSEISLKEFRETIEIEVLDALRNIDVQWKQVKLARMALKLAEQKLQIERRKLNAGKTTNFQIVSFENDLVTSQNSELDAIIGYSNSLSSLDQTLGTTLQTWKIQVRGDSRQELTHNEQEESQ